MDDVLADAIIEDSMTAKCGHRVEVTEICDTCGKCLNECCVFDGIHEIRTDLKPFYDEIDINKLQAAKTFVETIGSGGKAYYTQEINHPYLMDVYITVSLRGEMWHTEAFKYGGDFFPQMREALSRAFLEICLSE